MNQSARLNAAILRTTAEWSRQDVKKRQKKGKERARERESRWNNNKVKGGGRQEER